MVLRIKKTASDIGFNDPDLITRPLGKKMYERICTLLCDISDGETVILDFNGIKVIDTSCIDEFLVRLIFDSMKEPGGFHVMLSNISEISENNIDSVFRSYSNYKNRRIVVMTSELRRNNSFFIGPLSDGEREVVYYIRINRSASFKNLSEFTGLNKIALSELLGTLYSLRVIKRDQRNVFFSLETR